MHEALAAGTAASKASGSMPDSQVADASLVVANDTGRGYALKRAARSGSSRPVGPKATPAQGNGQASTHDTRILGAQDRQGELRFFLQRVAGGLYVEREEFPRRGVRTLLSLQFTNAAEFSRWCDNDPIRFEYPLLHVNLKRDGDELWSLVAGGSVP